MMAEINPLYPITELTQAQYDALGVKDPDVLYAIPFDGVPPSHQRPAPGSTLPCILITQADYDALGTYDGNTLYCIGQPEPSYDETKITVVLLDGNDEPTDYITYVDSISEAASYLNDNLSNRYLVHIGKSSGVTDIGTGAFENCTSLVYIDITDNVTFIGGRAFESTSLKTVSFPDSITELFSDTVAFCNDLESVHLPCNLSKTDSGNFNNCTALTSINIPETWLIWGSNEFVHCHSLKEITLPQGLQIIRDSTFDQCYSLKNVTIPDSVTTIEEQAFYQCDSFTEIILPESVSSIGVNAFERQSIGNRYPVCIGRVCNSVPGSPWGAEDYNIHWMKKVGIYSANNDGSRSTFITNFDTLALAINYLNNNSSGTYCLSCGDTIEESMPAVQMKTALYGLFLSGSSLTLNPAAFAGNSNLRYVSIGIGVQTIPISCFASCGSLATIYIGKNVETISDNAFAGCSTLQSITIPANVEQISASAFSGCFGLTSITVNKPENSISGAPWGASNATVVWTG